MELVQTVIKGFLSMLILLALHSILIFTFLHPKTKCISQFFLLSMSHLFSVKCDKERSKTESTDTTPSSSFNKTN